MYDKHFITHEVKHDYYNKIYPILHTKYDKNTRVYTKEPKGCDFEFKDGKLNYNNPKDVDFSNADKIFPSFKNANKELNVQETISYYLNNNIVPGFSSQSDDNFKKENIYKSKDIDDPESYKMDKTFNIKKDDLSIYNESFFMQKEIEKKMKQRLKERDEAKDKK